MTMELCQCSVTEAYRQPVATVLQIAEARAFKQVYVEMKAWDEREQNRKPHPPRGAMVDKVQECLHEKAREMLAERRARGL